MFEIAVFIILLIYLIGCLYSIGKNVVEIRKMYKKEYSASDMFVMIILLIDAFLWPVFFVQYYILKKDVLSLYWKVLDFLGIELFVTHKDGTKEDLKDIFKKAEKEEQS